MEKSSLQITKNDSNYIIILNKPPNRRIRCSEDESERRILRFYRFVSFYLRMIRWSGNMMFNNCHVSEERQACMDFI